MAQPRTLTTRYAITGTAILWMVTIATAVTGAGSDRLHLTLLTASLVAAVACLAVTRQARIDQRIEEVRADAVDVVRQGFDELHAAVDQWGEALRQDRQLIVAARTLTAELVHHRHQHRDRVA